MTRPGTRAEKIAAIHKERENSAAFAQNLGKHLAEVGIRLADIERVRTGLLDRVEDDARDLLRSWSVPLRDLSDRIAREGTELQRVHTRLSRTALNVGMVGRARQGKSRFLQSLTGLTSQEIPDGAVGFCTGVPSIAQHMPGGKTYADVYFHTPESFMSEVIAPYYERLELGRPPSSPIGFSGKPLANLPLEATAEQQAAYGHLSSYHRTYPEYESLIGAVSPRQVGAADIRRYVAQDDEAGQRTYNAFRAVRRVQIATEFPRPDLDGVSVIDLPGLGDTNLGDSRIMLSELKDDVDLVLFLRRPSPEGDSIHDYDINLYDIARDSLAEIPMERRSFLILNHRQSPDPALDNMASCQAFAEQVAGSPIRVAKVMIADCSSGDEVGAAFENVVDYLLDNIGELDRMLLDERTRRAAEINEQARLLAAQLQSLGAHAQSTDEWFMEFQALFSETYEDLSAAIERLVRQYEAERESDDSKFQQAVEATVEKARADDGIPSITDIERQVAVYGAYAATYSHLLDETRAHLSRQFLHLDVALKDAVRQMWDDVAKVLAEAGRFGQIDELKDGGGRDFLIAMARRIPPKVRRDGDSEVQYALQILTDFDLSYRSFIQHRIRDCLNGMQADHPRIEIPPNVSPPPDAVFIHEALSETYKGTLWDCEQRLQDLLKEPNRALFGIVEEFRDRVLRSRRIQNEWRTIYQDVRAEVWADQFAALAESAVHLRLWNETVNELKDLISIAPRRPDA
jgi:hypothetical protein